MSFTGKRVIILLDLDCFYAQCERVRLGLDEKDCALALLQVRSVQKQFFCLINFNA
jgi:nucleotidyltransferase/DNA polymerase involved in DNA repair